MHVHPEIAALRTDPASQRCAQDRMREAQADWHRLPQARRISCELAQYGAGQPLSQCPGLTSLLTDLPVAAAFVAEWQSRILGALSREPLGEVPHHYSCSAGLSNIRLMEHGRAALSILAYERRGGSQTLAPQTALFADRECRELVLAGSGSGTLHHRQGGSTGKGLIASNPAHWKSGNTIELAGADQARQISQVEGSMVLLQLSRTAEKPGPSQELQLDDGEVLQLASGDKSASQRLMALAVLGAAQSEKALPVMRGRALDKAEDADVRWEAVRQTLSIDAARGIALLDILRRDEADPLAGPACDLLDSLIRANPSISNYIAEAA
ncbi:HEAT repeat domain-containing protein [Erythrobacter sp. MTPC3]|uniref:HEAT repeat domain-containing protein n=1 Tax=Erythrobacter sp. MTPC3 TaxID=3056564 RepID=UPI0036F3015A